MNTITIRDAKLEDAERLAEIYAYYVEETAISFEYEAPTVSEFRERMKTIMMQYPYLVIEKDSVIMGYAYAGKFYGRAAYNRCCETTIYLHKDAKRCGFGKKIYAALEERLKAMSVLNLYACIAYPEVDDKYLSKNSAEFHAHCGFTEIGRFHKCGYKFNRWYDMIYMEKIIGDHL